MDSLHALLPNPFQRMADNELSATILALGEKSYIFCSIACSSLETAPSSWEGTMAVCLQVVSSDEEMVLGMKKKQKDVFYRDLPPTKYNAVNDIY